jgi:putative aldouronate transport system permease protein
MLLPGLVWLFIYKYAPMYGAVIAFKEYDISKGILQSPWKNPLAGHFIFFYESPYFFQLIRNTVLISIYKLFFGTLAPIFLAVLLNECNVSWYKRMVQTITYMPYFFSWVIIYGIAYAFLSQGSGLINRWLAEAGLEKIPFLSSPEWFRTVLVGTSLWNSSGWGAIIYLAAMASIDPSLYEAARIDGAGRFRMIWHITLTGIRSVIILMLILNLGKIMDAGFEQVFVFYNVNVYEVGDILDTWVYRVGLEQFNFSLASAVGLFKSLIGLSFVFVSNLIARRWGEGLW